MHVTNAISLGVSLLLLVGTVNCVQTLKAMDGECTPQPGELVVNSTVQFDSVLETKNITTLFYVGYAANTDMMFGVGGMHGARFVYTIFTQLEALLFVPLWG
jgi:hypothetical protein